MDSQEQAEALPLRAFESLQMVIIALTLGLCVLGMVTALTSQENGRLQGELSRVEAQLRNMRTK